eukprot:13961737-Heterocapsa_arctica.AAC.1
MSRGGGSGGFMALSLIVFTLLVLNSGLCHNAAIASRSPVDNLQLLSLSWWASSRCSCDNRLCLKSALEINSCS